MRAINVQKLTIKCDSCNFKKEIGLNKAKEWHNKECPECSAIVISDSDIKQLDNIVALADLTNALVGEVEDGTTVTAIYDSAKPNILTIK